MYLFYFLDEQSYIFSSIMVYNLFFLFNHFVIKWERKGFISVIVHIQILMFIIAIISMKF